MAIIQLTPRVWHTLPVEAGDRPALGLVAGEKAALLIDGGNSPAHVEELLRAAEEGAKEGSVLVSTTLPADRRWKNLIDLRKETAK